ERRLAKHLDALIGQDVAACLTTDAMGWIHYRNAAAFERFGQAAAATMVALLHEQFASPSAVLYRLQARASAKGSAREDVVTRRGHMRLSVHHLAHRHYLWRIEEFQDRSPAGRGAEGLSLPMVVIN